MQRYKVKYKDVIRKYGKEVLASKEFAEARTQVHHKYTTVANHTLFVTDTVIGLGRLLRKLHLCKPDEKTLVLAALCHDLGIIGRDVKFSSDSECYRCHPKESVKVTRRLYPKMDARTLNAIESHMYPLTKRPPHSAEGFILITADKICSVTERIYLEINRKKRVK